VRDSRTETVGQGNLPHRALIVEPTGEIFTEWFTDSYEFLSGAFDTFTRVSLPAAEAEFWAEDNGLAMLLPVNVPATLLYWSRCGVGNKWAQVPANITPIVGRVAITAATDYGDSVGLAEWQCQYLEPLLTGAYARPWLDSYYKDSPLQKQWKSYSPLSQVGKWNALLEAWLDAHEWMKSLPHE